MSPNTSLKIIAGHKSGAAGLPKNGPALKSGLNTPIGIATDKFGNIYVTDCFNHTVEKLTLKRDGSYIVSIIAGSPNGVAGLPTPGPALQSLLHSPCGIDIDCNQNIFVADSGNNIVEKLTLQRDGSYVLSIIAGSPKGIAGLPTPGPAKLSLLNCPNSIGIDSKQNLFVADYENSIVEKLSPNKDGTYTLSIIAGSPKGIAGLPTPGPSTLSLLHLPSGIAVDNYNNVYIADEQNNVIEKLTLKSNGRYTLSIIAGSSKGIAGLPKPGPAKLSLLNKPNGVAVDNYNNVYIADEQNSLIEKLTLNSNGRYTLSIIAGNHKGIAGLPKNGSALKTHLKYPDDLTLDICGNVYICDTQNNVIEKLIFM